MIGESKKEWQINQRRGPASCSSDHPPSASALSSLVSSLSLFNFTTDSISLPFTDQIHNLIAGLLALDFDDASDSSSSKLAVHRYVKSFHFGSKDLIFNFCWDVSFDLGLTKIGGLSILSTTQLMFLYGWLILMISFQLRNSQCITS